MNRCIITFGKNHNFERGVDRLEQLVDEIVGVPFFGFKEYPIGCPTHDVSPFAFKFYCIKECIAKGFTTLLWLDSSVVIKNNLEQVFHRIDTTGYFFVNNTHSIGQFCHDKALNTLNVTRDTALKLPSLQGTNFGLNMLDARCQTFLDCMLKYSVDGITFPGPHNNNNQLASHDPRVSGHRHEQTAMSVEAIRLKMTDWARNESPWFFHDREFVKSVASTVEEVNMAV